MENLNEFMHDVAVIILNYNMRPLVEACLRSLFFDIYETKLSVRVIITDNNSSDGLRESLPETFPDVTVINTGGNMGFARGVNTGIRAVNARYYFILNPDTEFIEPHTIERLHAWMENHTRVGVCSPRLMNSDGSLQYSCHPFPSLLIQPLRRTKAANYKWICKRIDSFLMRGIDHNQTRPVDWVMGSALFIRASALNETGFLDERFWMYYEDADWCRRFWRQGWPIYYIGDVALMHRHGRASARVAGTIKPLIVNRVAREHVKSWAKYFWKWRGERGLKII